MKHILVCTNLAKDPELAVTKKVSALITDKGMRCSVATTKEEILSDVDGILVLGGDGTMLRVAADTLEHELPILGINLGSLGYLTEVDENRMEEAIERLSKGDYKVTERMMLEGRVIRDGEEIYKGVALNDIVLTRKGSLRIIHFDITVNGDAFNEYDADGMIVSTPTGSTGYNMSAGGPIVEPQAGVMIMTPICPHMFNSRSVVISSSNEVEIKVNADRTGNNQEVELTFDAGNNLSLTTGDVISIKKADKVTKIVRLSDASFIEALHRKMNS